MKPLNPEIICYKDGVRKSFTQRQLDAIGLNSRGTYDGWVPATETPAGIPDETPPGIPGETAQPQTGDLNAAVDFKSAVNPFIDTASFEQWAKENGYAKTPEPAPQGNETPADEQVTKTVPLQDPQPVNDLNAVTDFNPQPEPDKPDEVAPELVVTADNLPEGLRIENNAVVGSVPDVTEQPVSTLPDEAAPQVAEPEPAPAKKTRKKPEKVVKDVKAE